MPLDLFILLGMFPKVSQENFLLNLYKFFFIDKPVAVKIVSLATLSGGESEVLAESIITEIEMSKRLSRASKHVVRMYDFDFHRQTGLAFLVMELGEQDLEKTLKGQPRLSPAERKNIWRQLVDIAIILHNNHIVIKVLFLYNFLLFFHIGTS